MESTGTGITIAALIALSSVIIGFARSIKTFLANCNFCDHPQDAECGFRQVQWL